MFNMSIGINYFIKKYDKEEFVKFKFMLVKYIGNVVICDLSEVYYEDEFVVFGIYICDLVKYLWFE